MADDLPMKPLQNSWAANDVENDLRNLALQLYDDNLRELADEINVYGVPHLGPFRLVERNVTRDGLMVLRQGDEVGMRYLFKAWRFRNPRRGFHFLRTYLQVLFGDVSEIAQLWQKKSEPYPTALKSLADITNAGESVSDYFLTSRVSVNIDTEIVPSRITASLKSTLAARFVIDVRLAKFQASELAVAQNIVGGNIFFGSAEAIAPQTSYLTDQFGELLTDQDELTLEGY